MAKIILFYSAVPSRHPLLKLWQILLLWAAMQLRLSITVQSYTKVGYTHTWCHEVPPYIRVYMKSSLSVVSRWVTLISPGWLPSRGAIRWQTHKQTLTPSGSWSPTSTDFQWKVIKILIWQFTCQIFKVIKILMNRRSCLQLGLTWASQLVGRFPFGEQSS